MFSKESRRSIGAWASAHKPLSIVIVLVVFSLVYVLAFKPAGTAAGEQYVFGRVTQGDLAVTVSGSGQVATLGEVSIKPQTVGQSQTLGQIVSVNVKNGDFVKQGQVIAVLDGQNALQTLNQAKASVASAQANYDTLINGPTAQDLQSTNDGIASDETSIANEQQTILQDLHTTYASVSNAVYISTDPFFRNVTTAPTLSITNVNFLNQQLETSLNTGRTAVGATLAAWQQEINAAFASGTSTDFASVLTDSIAKLNSIRTYFDNMTTLFSVYGVAGDSSSQSTLNSDKSTASGARSTLDSAISTLTSALQSYQNDLTNLAQDQQTLAYKIAPPNANDVTVAKANLDNAEANLANAEQNYASRIITAPFDGQIGGLNAQIGQQVSSSDSLGTLITAERVVDVELNEVDASKVAANDPVTVTFDALPNVSVKGHVNYVDPLGSVSQGVVSYDVQVVLDEQNNAILTGMTATADITVADHQNALYVPTAAIQTINGKSYVLVADASATPAFAGGFSSSTRAFASSSFARSASSTAGFGGAGFASSAAGRMRMGSSTGNAIFAASGASAPTVHPVLVTTGIVNDTDTEILSGLSAGELIVTRTISAAAASAAKTAASAATSRTFGGGAGGAIRIGGGGFGGGAVGTFSRGG